MGRGVDYSLEREQGADCTLGLGVVQQGLVLQVAEVEVGLIQAVWEQ